jgi:hypothetical protein
MITALNNAWKSIDNGLQGGALSIDNADDAYHLGQVQAIQTLILRLVEQLEEKTR